MAYTIEDKCNFMKKDLLLRSEKNPFDILLLMMKKDYISMHGPEHHFLDGACFLVALKNNGYEIDIEKALAALEDRSLKMPAATCGNWGVCGSVNSLGATLSIIDKTTPLSSDQNYVSHMLFTSKFLEKLGTIGGPRCCKRSAYLAMSLAISYAKEHYHIDIEDSHIDCEYSQVNKTCIHERCPFYKK